MELDFSKYDMVAVAGKVNVVGYDELKAVLTENLSKYKGYSVSEEGLADAKKTRAAMNSLKKTINDRRLEVQRQYLKPFEAAKEQADTLIAIINEVSDDIDNQIKAIEEKQDADKYQAIFNYWENAIGDLKEEVPLEKAYQDRWLNKACGMNVVMGEIDAKVKQIRSDLESIGKLPYDSEDKAFVRLKYLDCLDLGKALQAHADHEQEMARVRESALKAEEENKAIAQEASEEADEKKVPYAEITFTFTGTKDDMVKFLTELSKSADSHGITYTLVRKA